ncbi:MAG TPA: hypothetical protein VHU82_04030 [Vicinamibacterales bacterium]|nr:hypothetical protein [Vicinamibacterales bacterium]
MVHYNDRFVLIGYDHFGSGEKESPARRGHDDHRWTVASILVGSDGTVLRLAGSLSGNVMTLE